MGKDGPDRRLAHACATILAVWLALILAAASIAWVPDESSATALLSIAVYMALLVIVAFRLGFGRRTPAWVFLLGGILYPFTLPPILLVVEALGRPDALLTAAFVFAAGLGIGFQSGGGGPDTPFEAYLLSWMLNLLVPMILVLGARALIPLYGRD